jgi:hypothetical protein
MWLIELLIDLLGITVFDRVVERMPAWGCALIIGGIALVVLLVVWLT